MYATLPYYITHSYVPSKGRNPEQLCIHFLPSPDLPFHQNTQANDLEEIRSLIPPEFHSTLLLPKLRPPSPAGQNYQFQQPLNIQNIQQMPAFAAKRKARFANFASFPMIRPAAQPTPPIPPRPPTTPAITSTMPPPTTSQKPPSPRHLQ
ncbi:MAG: hypothetical protein ACREBR_03075 [bacterium]